MSFSEAVQELSRADIAVQRQRLPGLLKEVHNLRQFFLLYDALGESLKVSSDDMLADELNELLPPRGVRKQSPLIRSLRTKAPKESKVLALVTEHLDSLLSK